MVNGGDLQIQPLWDFGLCLNPPVMGRDIQAVALMICSTCAVALEMLTLNENLRILI